MVGKTSLIKATQDKLNRQTVYVNLWGAKGIQGLLNALVRSINASTSLTRKIKDAASRIEGLSVGPSGLAVTVPRRPLTTLWNLLDLLSRQEENLVIELDEVQELSNVSGQLLKVLANIFNTHPHVIFVFTGSMFGLIRTLLNPESSHSPMYGRPPAELYLQRFNKAQVAEFLKRGFKECGIKPPSDLITAEVEEKIDGTPGWLTLYGNNIAIGKLSPELALQKTVEQGLRVVRDELEHFLEGRDRSLYIGALSAMVSPATWSDIKRRIEVGRGTPVSDSTVQSVLKSLEEGLIVEHKGKVYQIADPMMHFLMLSGTMPSTSNAVTVKVTGSDG